MLFVSASFLFLPVVIVLFLVILAFVYLAVPAEVAAEWILGDGAVDRKGDLVQVSGDGFRQLMQSEWRLLESPWLRVPIFLTIFSVLYLAAQLQSTEENKLRPRGGYRVLCCGSLGLVRLPVRGRPGGAERSASVR